MTRTSEQVRHEAAWHEAAHAVAYYLHGHPIERAEVYRLGELREEGKVAGCVIPTEREVQSVCEAQEAIVELLAGEAGVRVAWERGVISDTDIGGREVPLDDLSTDELLVGQANGDETRRAVSRGWYQRQYHSDAEEARRLAQVFSGDLEEALALLSYCQSRTVSMARSERFQRLAGVVAAALLEHSMLEGRVITNLLDRADELYRIEEGSTG